MVFPGGSDAKESTCNAGDLDSVSGLGRSPGRGHGNPCQYSCLECSEGLSLLPSVQPPVLASALKEPDVLILAFSLCYIENEVDSLQEVSFRVLMYVVVVQSPSLV